MAARTEAKPLDVMFPDEKVELPDGTFVVVRPLSLAHFPKLMKSIASVIMGLSERTEDMPVQEIGMDVMVEITEFILPSCIDRNPHDVPFDLAPKIVGIIVEQNFTGNALKNWSALGAKLGEMFGVDVKSVLSESAEGLKKSLETSR